MSVILSGALGLGLLWAVMTIGVYLSYRVLDIADLTAEGSIVLGASVAAVIIKGGASPVAATLAALVAGMLAGLSTGILHTVFKIPSLIAGILTMTALYSINIRVMGNAANVTLLRLNTVFSWLTALDLNSAQSVIISGIMLCVLVIAAVYWFLGTEIGCGIRATGSNANMARAQGINTNAAKCMGLALSNGIIALAGAMLAQYQGFADVSMGVGSIAIGLASVIIGEVIFGTGTLPRTLFSLVLGAISYRVIIALVLELGMRATDLKLFTALTVVAALYLPYLKRKLSAMRQRSGGYRKCCD